MKRGHFNPGHFNPRPFNPGLFNHELSNPGFFNPSLGVEKSGVEKSGVEKFMVEMSGVEKFLFALGLTSSWLKSPGLKGLGLKLGFEKFGVELSFNPGGDKQTILTHLNSPEMGWKMTCLMHETVKKFYTLPALSVALVHGRALGGGAELCLAPDLRIFAEKSGKLSFVQAKMGLMTGWAGGSRLYHLLGSR